MNEIGKMTEYHFVSKERLADIFKDMIEVNDDYVLNVYEDNSSFSVYAEKREFGFEVCDKSVFFPYIKARQIYLPFDFDKIISLYVPKTKQKFYLVKESK